MGRTIPAFRLAQMYEEAEWKSFRSTLSKARRKEFDRMFATSRLYISACSYAAKPVRIQPIFMAIIFHHYKQLVKISEKLGTEEVKVSEPISR
jgi:hypothetical protein